MTTITSLNDFENCVAPLFNARANANDDKVKAAVDAAASLNGIAHLCVLAFAANVDPSPSFKKKDGNFYDARSALTYAKKIKETLLSGDPEISILSAPTDKNDAPIPFHSDGQGSWTRLEGINGWAALINADTSHSYPDYSSLYKRVRENLKEQKERREKEHNERVNALNAAFSAGKTSPVPGVGSSALVDMADSGHPVKSEVETLIEYGREAAVQAAERAAFDQRLDDTKQFIQDADDPHILNELLNAAQNRLDQISRAAREDGTSNSSAAA